MALWRIEIPRLQLVLYLIQNSRSGTKLLCSFAEYHKELAEPIGMIVLSSTIRWLLVLVVHSSHTMGEFSSRKVLPISLDETSHWLAKRVPVHHFRGASRET